MLHHGAYTPLEEDNEHDTRIELADLDEANDDVNEDANDADDDDASDANDEAPETNEPAALPQQPETDHFMQNIADCQSILLWLVFVGLSIYLMYRALSVDNVETTKYLSGWRFCRDSNQYCETMSIVGPCVCAKYCPDVSVAVRNDTLGAFDNCIDFFQNPKYCDVLFSYSACITTLERYIDEACKLSDVRDWKRQKAPWYLAIGLTGVVVGTFRIGAFYRHMQNRF